MRIIISPEGNQFLLSFAYGYIMGSKEHLYVLDQNNRLVLMKNVIFNSSLILNEAMNKIIRQFSLRVKN